MASKIHRRHHDKYAHLAAKARRERERAPKPKPPAPLPDIADQPPPFSPVRPGLDAIDIFHFNDFHRQLEPAKDTDLGGAARLATALKALQHEHRNDITVNLGDVAYDDGPVTGKRSFEPIPELFREMGVSILELGNHEFQDPANGYAALHNGLLSQFQGEVLCGNVRDALTEQPVRGTKPYTIKQLAGMNVAFIGVVTQDMATRAHPNVALGLTVLPLADTLRSLIPEVRQKGADAVVVLAHESFNDCVTIAEQVPGIDLLLAAHDHKLTVDAREVRNPEGRTTVVSEAGSHGQYLGHARLVVDPRERRVVSVEDRILPIDRGIAPDPQVQAIVDRYRNP